MIEQKDDPPGLLAYHTGGFTYPRQPLDILRSFIVYRLWTERCRKHFDDKYSLKATLTQAWVATVEVGMVSWKAIRSQRLTKDQDTQTIASSLSLEKNGSTQEHHGDGQCHHPVAFPPPLVFPPFN
jgi:hypothetical protein